jgi:hypothetical protein
VRLISVLPEAAAEVPSGQAVGERQVAWLKPWPAQERPEQITAVDRHRQLRHHRVAHSDRGAGPGREG